MPLRPLLLACACALAAPTQAQADPPKLDDPFFSYTRPAEYDSVSKTGNLQVPVHVPGGAYTYIACTLLRPAKSGTPAPGKFPGIIADFNAYHLVMQHLIKSGTYDFFPRHGYNLIVCDAPGSGNSPGLLDEFGPDSTQANLDLIEWFATQPWSDGNIGQQGVSYGGHTTNLVAARHPPHLKAIVSGFAFADWYEQTIYHGGIRNFSILYQPFGIGLVGMGGGNVTGALRGIWKSSFGDYPAHPLYDDFWKQRSVKPHWSDFTVPALLVEGWNDRYKDGAIENYSARKDNVWLLLGPWEHAKYAGHNAAGTLEPTANQLAWYDHWLKNLPAAPLPRAKITSFEMPDDAASHGWQQLPDWPPPGEQTTRLVLTPARTLAAAPAPGAPLQWTVDRWDKGSDPASGGAKPGVDQAGKDAQPYRLAFTAAPLTQDAVLAGSAEVHLDVSFSETDGNLVARLMDVNPDGSVTQVATGWLKASHYKGHDHLETITPGQTYPMQVHVLPSHWRFRKGHAIRISLSSGDFPDIAPNAPKGTVSLRLEQGGCWIELPLLDGGAAAR